MLCRQTTDYRELIHIFADAGNPLMVRISHNGNQGVWGTLRVAYYVFDLKGFCRVKNAVRKSLP